MAAGDPNVLKIQEMQRRYAAYEQLDLAKSLIAMAEVNGWQTPFTVELRDTDGSMVIEMTVIKSAQKVCGALLTDANGKVGSQGMG